MPMQHEIALTSSSTGPYQEPMKSVPHSYTLLLRSTKLPLHLPMGRFRPGFRLETQRNCYLRYAR
jgi:hypothetical protein